MSNFLPHGVHQISDTEYHADPSETPSLSSTIGKLLLSKSPKHAWTASPRLNPNFEPKNTATFDVGKAAHSAILGKGADVAEIPSHLLGSNGSASTKAAKDFIADCREAGVTPLKSDVVEKIACMKQIMDEWLSDMDIALDPARSEMAVLAEIGGVSVRAMVDNAPAASNEPLYDFKTCEDASPDAVTRSIMNYGYDFQARHYVETWRAATGEDRLFRFIFQEKSEPYEIALVELTEHDLLMAGKKTQRARDIWGNCIKSDYWPGYPRGVIQPSLPDFFAARYLERESMEADHKARTGQDILDAARRWQSPEPLSMAGE